MACSNECMRTRRLVDALEEEQAAKAAPPRRRDRGTPFWGQVYDWRAASPPERAGTGANVVPIPQSRIRTCVGAGTTVPLKPAGP